MKESIYCAICTDKERFGEKIYCKRDGTDITNIVKRKLSAWRIEKEKAERAPKAAVI